MENLEAKKFVSCLEDIVYAGYLNYTKGKVYEVINENFRSYEVIDNYGDINTIFKDKFMPLWEK